MAIKRNHRPQMIQCPGSISILQPLLVTTLVIILRLGMVCPEGNIGCKFVPILCVEGTEVCFDDKIFGKCIPTSGVEGEELERINLSERQSQYLVSMLEELQGAGLGWDHPYVQCRVQGALFSIRKQTRLPPTLCDDLTATPMEGTDTSVPLSFVGFLPTDHNSVDKHYYPAPLKKQSNPFVTYKDDYPSNLFHSRDLDAFSQVLQKLREPDSRMSPYVEFDRDLESQMHPESNFFDDILQKERNRIANRQRQRQQQRQLPLIKEHLNRSGNLRPEDLGNRLELYELLSSSEPDPQPFVNRKSPFKRRKVEENSSSLPGKDDDRIPPPKRNKNALNRLPSDEPHGPSLTHSFFRELMQEQHPEEVPFRNHLTPPHRSVKQHYPSYYNSLLRNSLTPFEEEAMLNSNTYDVRPEYNEAPSKGKQGAGQVFTEGGPLTMSDDPYAGLPDRQMADEEDLWRREETRDLLANMLGFTRSERLDVKKPGPWARSSPLFEQLLEKMPSKSEELRQQNSGNSLTHAQISPTDGGSKTKKLIQHTHSAEDHAPHTVDTEYTHVFVKNPIDIWNDGVRIVNELANILHMQGYFTYLTVRPHEVSFRVNSDNPEHKTAADIARAINENSGVKNNLLRRLGVTVLKAGVGDRVRLEDFNNTTASSANTLGADGVVSEVALSPDRTTHVMAYVLAGAGVALILAIFIALVLVRRKDRKRSKLYAMQEGNVDGCGGSVENCSKDYQDLCRARMAGGKEQAGSSNDVAGGLTTGRLTSLARDNERPPSSSRSSTSSWSEEPALTNMDISTGHMVLAYMEDHLRNKDRLQREWDALCRYEAEPNQREAALQPKCSKLNREGAPLPYDHSRVILNHLINADELDYINASIITDHDPRAPAYVAAQGPLASTLTHFWQMIWEQGAVVIVALCRLQENGSEMACVRYWPEEGADVYHIYEVNLVSEHIWCDDYLVRSFYLKNLRTGETRTVTQFHFLSWPANGVPLQAKALLEFRRKVNKSYRGRSCPIVVHGSTGAGRTGAYILLDLVLGRMHKGAREIDIAATLEHLRDQRAGLVSTKQQFEFVLMAVAEEVHAILRALPANQTSAIAERGIKEEAMTTTPSAVNGVASSSMSKVNNSRIDAKRMK